MLNIKSTNHYFVMVAILFVIIFTLASCGKEEEIVIEPELTIAGNWTGAISQVGYEDFIITVSIADPTIDDLIDKVIGTGNYDEECKFNWIYTGNTGDKFILSEKIISGFSFCIDGIVELRILNVNELSYSWTDEDDDDNTASGKLTKV